MTLYRRGLTLIEVLMAVVLLALLAALAADGLRASLQALRPGSDHADIVHLAVAIDNILAQKPETISGLAAGDRTEILPEASSGWSDPIEFRRLECTECPPGFGHLELRSNGIVLSRFTSSSPMPSGGAP